MARRATVTLTGNVVATVKVDGGRYVEIVKTDGDDSPVFFTVDGTDPTLGADAEEVVAGPPGASHTVAQPNMDADEVTVKLVCAETAGVHVRVP